MTNFVPSEDEATEYQADPVLTFCTQVLPESIEV